MIGFATFLAMAEHGALWVAMKTSGALEARCRKLARIGWWLVLLLTALIAAISPSYSHTC
jgi:cytochrome bd-type quinol oxidase subunit 2